MKKILIKILSIFIVIIMIINIIFLVAGIINPLYFWIIIAICAIIAFFGIPRMTRKTKKE